MNARDLGRRSAERMHTQVPRYSQPEPVPGAMGRYPGDQSPGVEGRDGYVWVRLYGSGNQPMQAWSPKIKPWPDLPVRVADERETRGEWVVVGENWGALGGPRGWLVGGVPPWTRDPNDWLRKRRIIDFHGHVATSGLVIEVYADWFPVRTGMRYFAGGTVDLTPLVPVSGARFAHVYLQFTWNGTDYDEVLDAVAGSLITGAVGPGGYPTNPDASEDYIPAVPVGAFPCLAVLLVAGATSVGESDCYDTRSIWNPAGYGERATQVGQVMYSRDGETFTAELPVTDPAAGWLVDDVTGILLVHDLL